MAFKILSQDELAMLSERERKIYEQAYEEHMERAAFVEKLERLDKVKLPEVSIRMKGVRMVKAPDAPAVRKNGYKADTTAGADLLNVTKKVRATLENGARVRTAKDYKAVLPAVKVAVPDKVSVKDDKPFVVGEMPAVPLAVPQQTKVDIGKFDAVLPELNAFEKPAVGNVVIDDYSVEKLPDVRTAMPSVPNVDIKGYNAVLPVLNGFDSPAVGNVEIGEFIVSDLPDVSAAAPEAVNVQIEQYKAVLDTSAVIAVPDAVNVEIKPFKAEESAVQIASPDAVAFTAPDIVRAELSAVPIAEPQSVNVDIRSAEINVPAAVTVNAPAVNIEVAQAEISELNGVFIPAAAPEVHVAQADVKAVETPVVSVPEEISYHEPELRVETVKLPNITVPHVDADAVLNKIMSGFR